MRKIYKIKFFDEATTKITHLQVYSIKDIMLNDLEMMLISYTWQPEVKQIVDDKRESTFMK